jgi:hypothetical protein
VLHVKNSGEGPFLSLGRLKPSPLVSSIIRWLFPTRFVQRYVNNFHCHNVPKCTNAFCERIGVTTEQQRVDCMHCSVWGINVSNGDAVFGRWLVRIWARTQTILIKVFSWLLPIKVRILPQIRPLPLLSKLFQFYFHSSFYDSAWCSLSYWWRPYTGCFKNSVTALKDYINLFRGHVQSFELQWCSKTHRVLSGIVIL